MSTQVLDVDIGLIDEPTHAHRISFDAVALSQLAASIKEHGLISPILVRPCGPRYEIIAGHRRYLAHKQLGLFQVKCIVETGDNSGRNTALQFAENFQRSDLSPIEEALALQRQIQDTDADLATLAQMVKRSENWVEQRLALLDLPDDLGPLVHNRTLAISAAIHLAEVTDPAHRQHLTSYCVNSGASAQTIQNWVQTWKQEQMENPGAPPSMPVLPTNGERPTIQLPCWSCRTATDYTTMQVIRLCPDCVKEGMKA